MYLQQLMGSGLAFLHQTAPAMLHYKTCPHAFRTPRIAPEHSSLGESAHVRGLGAQPDFSLAIQANIHFGLTAIRRV